MKITTINRFCILIFTILAALAVEAAAAAASSTDTYLLSCGSPSSVSAAPLTFDNRTWSSDNNRTFSPSFSSTTAANAANPNTSLPQIPFSTARIFLTNFTYSLPISAGPKFLRLYFRRTTYSSGVNFSEFEFSVEAINHILLDNFTAESTDPYLIKEFHVIVPDGTGYLNLTFAPASPESHAFVNGIEVVSVPANLYINTMWAPQIPFQFDGSYALETAYRLNIGGADVGAQEDGAISGMYRRWVSDDKYLDGDISGTTGLSSRKINYTWMVRSYTAPEAVYSTFRYLVANGAENKTEDLTWRLEVDVGLYYLVRLHWCSQMVEAKRVKEMVLQLDVNNKSSDSVVDLIELNSEAYVPAYRDYLVYADGGSGVGGRGVLSLALQPNVESNQRHYEASLNGLEIFKLNNRLDGSISIPQKGPPPSNGSQAGHPAKSTTGHHKKTKVLITASSVVAGMVMLGFILLFSYYVVLKHNLFSTECWSFRNYLLTALQKFNANPHKENAEDFLKNYASLVPRRYSYADIKRMTNSFREKLGEGGYGAVFKGKLQNGCDVAVKIWKQSKGDGQEFVNEVVSICRTNHINIVTLLGFCFEGQKRALVYEYMPNGSLEKFIHGRDSNDNTQSLSLQKLFEIAVGIARGLEYLHRGCNTRILHFDIKPHNILLDAEFTPKISDFGLAKSCNQKESKISMSGARGTAGYIAPEVFFRSFGGVSHKSDVYSYGMMVLEMVGCRTRVCENGENSSDMYFPQWIYKQLEQETELNSRILNDEEKELERKMILVGLWCIQTNPSSRPQMSEVVEMLEGKVELLDVPPMPLLSSLPRPQQAPTDVDSSELSSDQLQ